MNELVMTTLQQGLIYAILAIGVYITYKVLNLADLTIEGAFPLGAFIFAYFVLNGTNPAVATVWAFFAGALAGLLTAFLTIVVKIDSLLSGILTLTALYTVNIRINGKANVPLFNNPSIFDQFDGNKVAILILLAGIVIAVKLAIDYFMLTDIGYTMTATGDNESFVRGQGRLSKFYIALGLMLGNGLGAVSGALMAQFQEFVDATMGNSIIVTGLASVIIGSTLLGRVSFAKGTTQAIVGALLYRAITGYAISLGLQPTDLKAISALIVILFLAYNTFIAPKIQTKKAVK